MHRLVGLVVLIGTLATLGCGHKPLGVHPVSGKVMVQGKPAVNAEVTLHAAVPLKDGKERAIFPTARVAADGTFQISTYQPNDGAPAGEYKVTVTWPKITVDAGEEIIGPDQLNGRYARPDKAAAVVQIQPGDNVLAVIDLK